MQVPPSSPAPSRRATRVGAASAARERPGGQPPRAERGGALRPGGCGRRHSGWSFSSRSPPSSAFWPSASPSRTTCSSRSRSNSRRWEASRTVPLGRRRARVPAAVHPTRDGIISLIAELRARRWASTRPSRSAATGAPRRHHRRRHRAVDDDRAHLLGDYGVVRLPRRVRPLSLGLPLPRRLPAGSVDAAGRRVVCRAPRRRGRRRAAVVGARARAGGHRDRGMAAGRRPRHHRHHDRQLRDGLQVNHLRTHVHITQDRPTHEFTSGCRRGSRRSPARGRAASAAPRGR